MALANYADLQSAVAAFLNRTDLTAIIPDLITLAEVRINGDLDARLQDDRTALATVANQETVDLPSDMISIRHLSVESDPVTTLQYQTPDTLDTAHPWGDAGEPRAYSIVGSKAYLRPIPDAVYNMDLVYKARVPSLASTGTTWLMTTFPSVYLYATLCEAAPYLKDDARVMLWEGKYRTAVETVNAQDWYSGSTMRVRSDVRP